VPSRSTRPREGSIHATQRYYDVEVASKDGATIVTVTGEMDLFAAPALSDALTQALERPEPIVVDLCDCSLFESSGLNALLTAHLAAEAEGGRIIVVRRPQGCADRTLSLTVPGYFAEHDSRDAALAAIAG
jgi:anti-anti-sigma factor